MPDADVAYRRLRAQRLIGKGFNTPADVVRWFGAVQAQDYAGALWAVGLRTTGATEADVEQALIDRTIVRTWPLRGTLHFVAAEDVRWMIKWFAPDVIRRQARRFRQYGFEERTFARSAAVFVKALEGGRRLSRPQLYALLERAGIATGGNRGLQILFRCAHDGLLCFGAREGKQPTFALLEEWVPKAKALDRDEALAELARRYFTSHGPATLQDFAWWSGLSAADARRAIEAAGAVPHAAPRTSHRPRHAVLLPPYDEFTIAYRDRGAVLDLKHAAAARNGIFSPTILLDGHIAGLWARRLTRDAVTVELQPFVTLTATQSRGLQAAAARYGRFVGRPVRPR